MGHRVVAFLSIQRDYLVECDTPTIGQRAKSRALVKRVRTKQQRFAQFGIVGKGLTIIDRVPQPSHPSSLMGRRAKVFSSRIGQ